MRRCNPRKGEHMRKNTGGPAFPTKPGHWMEEGMTLRDYFAAQALIGLISVSENYTSARNYPDASYASFAYGIADAMLEARRKE